MRLIINVEAQNDYYPGYPIPKRGVYYGCRMISSQYGRVFSDSHYEKIEKVYSIWICMNPPNYRGNTITRYALSEENLVGCVRESRTNYDLLTVIIICLGGPEAENYDGILRLLDVLFTSRSSISEKRRILEDDYGIQMTHSMEQEVSAVCNLSVGYEQRGAVRGRAEGRAEGVTESTLANLRNLMKNLGVPVEQAMMLLDIPEAERPRYASLLSKS